jgi:hypothetical protein
MQVPADAHIERDKLTRYLLVPRRKSEQSQFLARADFTARNPNALEAALRRLIAERDAVADRDDEYGIFYQVSGDLYGPDGKLQVTTVWLRQHIDGAYRFVTLETVQGGPPGKVNMKIELYQEVALTRDLPDAQLRAGDVAVVVDFVPIPVAASKV